ncbi:MAG: protein translocase subunit SecD [Candidatus Saccharimonadales bacterium]
MTVSVDLGYSAFHMSLRLKFATILGLAVVTAVLALPREDIILHALGIPQDKAKLSVRQGLDLQGGAQLVFQADMKGIPASQRQAALDSLIVVIGKRANFGGTSEVVVQRQGSDKVSVSLPGVKDVNEAIDRIGKTANLQFFEVNSQTNVPTNTGLSGKDVESATADYDVQKNQPDVRLKLKGGDSTKKFGELTTKLSQSGNYLLTMLDGQPTFGPAQTEPILDGTAILTGNLDVNQAKKIADEITAGALPVPVTLVEQRSVGPTLGKESVRASMVAGAIGLGVVALFMLAYYRLAGLLAVLALIIYTTITLTLYKLSALVPGYTIVLTLAGIAGFILSIGMAVDANILIFERLKEELRAGKSFVAAVEAAFDRAWSSIRDSNVSTLITCAILFMTSSATPIIRGFAVTLGLGVLISLFTAVVVTRTLLRLTIRQGWGRNMSWYGLRSVPEETK